MTSVTLVVIHLFGNIKGDMHCLPPTEDAFQLHLQQALHQLAVCKQAHTFQPTYPSATDFVGELVGGKLVATMMLKEAKPAAFKCTKYCRCRKSMCTQGYFCVRASVKYPHMSLHWGPQQMFKG